MDKLDFKKQVLSGAREKQQKIIDDFKSRINELKDSEMKVNEDQYDYDQNSHDSASNDLINKLANQLNFVVEEMNILNRMKEEEPLHNRVAVGSIVKTDKRIFFPSVSIEEFKVDGQELFGISTEAPIYSLMQNKTAGEHFVFNDETYEILEVY